jgi:L-fuculose-phosphate aldolase
MSNIENLKQVLPHQRMIPKYLQRLLGLRAARRQEQDCKQQLLYFGKLLQDRFFVSGTDGNLSVRLDDQRIMITPTGLSKGMMTSGDFVIVDPEGKKISGQREVSTEIDMHLSIYRKRPDIWAVVHAHPCTATGFASAGLPLNEPLCTEILMTLGEIPLAPYATTGTIELSESLSPFIGRYNAILMANHGVVAFGRSLLQAYQRIEAVEHFARVILVAHQLGRKNRIKESDIQKLLVAKERYSGSSA